MMFSKKALGFILYFGFGFLLAALIAVFAIPQVTVQDYIGVKQYSMLHTNEDAEVIQEYVDASARYSALYAKDTFLSRGGLYQEEGDQAELSESLCGSYIYNSFKSYDHTCIPDFSASFVNYFSESYIRYLNNYEAHPILYFATPGLETTETTTTVSLSTSDSIKLFLEGVETNLNTGTYPRSSIFGTYSSEQEIICSSGECVRDTAIHFYNLYTNNGRKVLDYVWGGESPYTYEDTILLQESSDSFFEGVSVTEREPGKTKFTQPGFDCSGWTWWVGKHAGISGFTNRLVAQDYFNQAESEQAVLVCGEDNPCYEKTINELGQPGDIFYHGSSKESIGHMGIYIGDGEIIHSRGSSGLVIQNVNTYAGEEKTAIVALYRYPYAENGLEEFPSSNLDVVIPQQGVLSEDERTALIVQLANELKIEPAVAMAVFVVETGGTPGLCDNGKPLIRFEPHIFCKESNSAASWCKGTTSSSQWRDNFADEGFTHGSSCRTNEVEWESLEHAKKINENAAYRSISTGVGQIMGFNHNFVGYPNAKSMHEAFAVSEEAQIRAFFAFIENNKDVKANGLFLLEAAQQKDFPAFAQIYNGQSMSCVSPLVGRKCYKDQLQDAYNDVSSQGFSTLASWKQNTNYIEFTPQVETTIDFSLESFTAVTDQFLPLLDQCDNNLRVCVEEKVTIFNAGSLSTIEQPQDGIAYDFVEQVLDCSLHLQDQCYCQLSVNTTENYELEIDEEGRLYFNEEELYQFDEQISELIIEVDEGEVDFSNENLDAQIDENTLGIGLFKNETNYTWSVIDQTNQQKICASPKTHYRFNAYVNELDKPLQFSYYVQDTVAPEQPVFFDIKQKICGEEGLALLFSWTVPKDEDPLYAFELFIELEESDVASVDHRLLADVIDIEVPEHISVLDKLYRSEGDNSYTYYYLVDKAGTIPSFESNETYYYKMFLYDHHGNVDKFVEWQSYEVQEITPEILDTLLGVDISEVVEKSTTLFNYGACTREEVAEEDESLLDQVLDFIS